MKKLISMLLSICVILCILPINAQAKSYELDETQSAIADRITEICTDNWEEKGVLPSVCIAQAYMESHIGQQCYENNLWGLYGGDKSFESLDVGIYEYLDIINNGRYNDALYHLDPSYQIGAIYDGGYCTADREHYVGSVNWNIDEFELTKYDKEIWENCIKKTSEESVTWKYIY